MSRDSGTTWEALTPPDTSGFLRDLFVDSRGRLFAASMGGGSGLHESKDGGRTWRRLPLRSSKNAEPSVDAVTVTSAGTIVAGTANGLQRFTAGGEFEVVDSASAFAIEACGKDTVYAAAYEKGLLRSTDDGRTWTPMTERQRLESRQSGYLTLTSVLCLDDGRLLVGSLGDGILFSEDHGLTWADASVGLRSLSVWGFAKGQDGSIYVASASGGVHRLVPSP